MAQIDSECYPWLYSCHLQDMNFQEVNTMRINNVQTQSINSTTAAGMEEWRFANSVRTDNSDRLESNSSVFQKLLEEKESKITISSLRSAPKVPYGYLARDGVITYNGVQFICDEKKNSICLGDTSDPRQVINIPLSGGGHLKVNRANLNMLSKAIGMFSPEDVNRILRTIHQDTKIQSVQKEVEDLEDGIGEDIASDNADEPEDKTDEN